MSKSKHSPLPWEVVLDDGISDCNGQTIVEETIPYESTGVHKEVDARLIVRRVNQGPAVDELIKFLKKAIENKKHTPAKSSTFCVNGDDVHLVYNANSCLKCAIEINLHFFDEAIKKMEKTQ